jgi:DNA-binding NarL/FixJ family response regulator
VMPLKILIADDHRLFRDGLRHLLDGHENFVVVGEAADGLEAIAAARRLRPDIVLMDISMPALNGIEATRRMLSEVGAARVIMLSMHSDRRFVIESLKAGAVGYLLKDSAFEELLAALKTVSANRVYLSRLVNDSVVNEYVSTVKRSPRSAFSLLTGREREVLQLLAEGKTTKETAVRLNVSIKTIETHRKQIMDRLGLRSVAELTKYAVREGLTALE